MRTKMTTNIMNKITAALSMKSSSSPSSSSPSLPPPPLSMTTFQPTENIVETAKTFDTDEEYHTLFTKRLPAIPLNSELNSTVTSINNDSEYQSFYSMDDFIGGPLSEEYLSFDYGRQSNSSRQSNSDRNSDFLRSITTTPADSSCGFHNTFSVLERHLNKNKTQFKLSQQQIEYLLMQNRKSAVQNDIYIDIPIADGHSLHTINGSVNGSMKDTTLFNDEEPPSLFELEFEAIERLRAVWGDSFNQTLNEHEFGQNENESPNSMTNDVSSLVEEFYQQDETDFSKNSNTGNEYIYHVAKSRNGQLYIRVRRNLRLDQVLCGNRVSQMTRAYDDIEAVTRLLEEKEKDLELTAHIGKDLLAENTRLKKHVEELENDIKLANENCQQLKYELNTKCNLLAALTNDDDVTVMEEEDEPMSLTSLNLDSLQKKITMLEHENKSLKNETSQLVKETDEMDEAERRIIENIKDELNSTRDQYDTLIYELDRLKDENKIQSETIEKLTSSLTEAHLQIKQLTTENDDQTSRLRITNENQTSLAMELAEFKERYQEVLNLLEETQKELRNQRKRAQPTVRSSLIPGIASLAYPPGESLQSELMESSLFSDHSLDSGIASDRGCGMMGSSYHQNNANAYKKAFDMVRSVSKTSDNMPAQMGSMSMSNSGVQPRMSSYPYGSEMSQRGSSIYGNSTYGASLGSKTFSRESLTSDSDDSYPGKPSVGVPGAPGAKDLEAALKRLTPAEVLVRRTMLSNAPPGTYSYEEGVNNAKNGFRTPDSIMSTGSSGLSCYSSNHPWRKKLELVMPMEGSQTLHHWNRLATPTLGGLLDERPGVTIRGGRGLDELGLHLYSLSDVEEDEADHPGKQYQTLNSIYTYTNSTVMHPDDGMSTTSSLPQSQMSSRIASISSSRQPSAPGTPHCGLSRRNSCTTFSVSAGLANMLNERGIKAVTPSALNTPAGQNHSPTVTPCNSPEGSPTRDRSPEPALFAGFLYSGADMIRRKIVGNSESPDRASRLATRNKILLSRQEKRALRSLRLMEKVESIGLENIIHTVNQSVGVSPLAIGSGRSRTASPMTQLTSLKNISSHRRSDDLYAVDRETIKAVLNKGLSHESLLSDITTDGSTTSSITNPDDLSDSTLNDKKPSIPAANQRSGPTNLGNTTSSSSNTTTTSDVARTPLKVKQMQRQKSRRSLINGGGGQRPDLGTVGTPNAAKSLSNNNKSSHSNISGNSTKQTQQFDSDDDDRSSIASIAPQQTYTQSFVGSISSLFFGRKGGLL